MKITKINKGEEHMQSLININKIKRGILPALLILTLGISVMAVVDAKALAATTSTDTIHMTKYNNNKIIVNDEDDDEHNGGDDGHNGPGEPGTGDGNGGHHGGDHNETEREHEREHEQFECSFRHGENSTIMTSDNSIEFKDDNPALKMEYTMTVNGVQYEVEINVVGNMIFEFEDSNGNNIVDVGEVLQTFNFHDKTWNLTVNEHNDTNGNIIYVMFSYKYNANGYDVIVNYYVYNKTVIPDVDGGGDAVKVELYINQWPWKSNTSKIAYMFKAEISLESEIYDGVYNATQGADEFSIYISLYNETFVKYSWNDTVVIDGNPTSVLNSYIRHQKHEYEREHEDEKEQEVEVEIKLSNVVVFPRFNESLYYDPIIGVEDDPSDVNTLAETFQLELPTETITNVFGDGELVLIGVMSSILLIGIIAAVYKRRRY